MHSRSDTPEKESDGPLRFTEAAGIGPEPAHGNRRAMRQTCRSMSYAQQHAPDTHTMCYPDVVVDRSMSDELHQHASNAAAHPAACGAIRSCHQMLIDHARHISMASYLLVDVLEHLDGHDRAGGAVAAPRHHSVGALADRAQILVLLRIDAQTGVM